MGHRDVKRVPLDFNWPINKVWDGYIFPASTEPCEECDGTGAYHQEDCLNCDGSGHQGVYADPPTGEGWQLWETTSEGSPVSPVFETGEALAGWCTDNATVFGRMKAAYIEWLRMIVGDTLDVGSLVVIPHGGPSMTFLGRESEMAKYDPDTER